jgi:hypothetical protein
MALSKEYWLKLEGEIDELFGESYAKNNPTIIGAFAIADLLNDISTAIRDPDDAPLSDRLLDISTVLGDANEAMKKTTHEY